MKKLIAKIIILSGFYLNGYSQEERKKDFGRRINDVSLKNDKVDINNRFLRFDVNPVVKNYRDIKGSPYIFDTFILGKIIGINQELMLRYNAFSDEIEIQKNETENDALLKDNLFDVVLINFEKYKLRLLNYINSKGEAVYGYLVELSNQNEVSLLRRDKIILENEKVPKTTFEPYYPAKFTKLKSEFYIETKDKRIIQMPKNKKELETLFPMKKEEITNHLKNSSFSLKDEKSLIEISKFIAKL
ncbi:hypothetical protein [Flavobacterium sp.]|uniref:hypothetical protein n=1 Tax=Flavobacterium sp. TaxID=239 RepID=UPI00286C3D33|nr:hypothetical protein [Flavobacterium sp.]